MSDLKVLSVRSAPVSARAPTAAPVRRTHPGVFYTAKGENLPVQMSVRSFAKLFSQVGRTTVFNLEIEKTAHPVLIWATQRDPITSRFTHIDFLRRRLDKPVKITVRSNSPALPAVPRWAASSKPTANRSSSWRSSDAAKVTIDISGMDVGTTIQIADVKLPERQGRL